MTATAAELAALSRLLDEVMDLAVDEREAWLATLPQADQLHVPMLRKMLAEQSDPSHPDFMRTLPKMGDEPPTGEEFAAPGERIGPYRLIREIGRGGMGAVWLADREDGTLQRQVALKLPRLAWGAGLADRMRRERDIGALLEHPHIARLYDAGVDLRGRPDLAFEYIAGQDIDTYCDSHDLGVPDRLRLFVQVARAVAYAHGRLVVHRDLKPSNVMVTEDGQAHLLDFGIAKLLHEAADATKLTQEHGRVLTPQYASPEQVRGVTITVISDVYSLGVLLYQLLTGSLPYHFKRQTPGAIEQAILEDEPPLASSRVANTARARALRGELDAILAKALRREADQRYQTVEALADDIGRHLNGERVIAQPDSIWYRMRRVLRRHRLPFATAGIAVVAVMLGTGVAIWQARKAQEAAERSRVVKEFIVDVFKVNARGDPAEQEVKQLPAEALLQRGAQLIATKFPGQPELQVDLYGIVGNIFLDMGAPKLAVEYQRRHVDALKSIGASPSDEAESRIQLGLALLMQERLKESQLQAERAVALSGPNLALRAKALLLLARVFDHLGRGQDASDLAIRIETEMGAPEHASATRAQAKWVRARNLYRLNKVVEARELYRSAISEALTAEGPLSPSAIEIRIVFAKVLTWTGFPDEARVHRQAALDALRSSGGVGDIRAALEEQKFAVDLYFAKQTSAIEAISAIERARETVRLRGALVPDTITASIDFELAKVYAVWGRVDLAEALLTRSSEVLRTSSEHWRDLYQIAWANGVVARTIGRHKEADVLLREALQMRTTAVGKMNPESAYSYLEISENLLMEGKFDEAESLLLAVPKFEAANGISSGPRAKDSVAIGRGIAAVKLERGESAAGLALMPPDVLSSDGQDADWQRVRGEMLCAVGRTGEGLPLLNAALDIAEHDEYKHSPYLARLRSVLGLCKVADGQRDHAVELARLARASFEAQPGISPYFKKPLIKLEQLLKRRG